MTLSENVDALAARVADEIAAVRAETAADLADYLPLTGGTLSGNLIASDYEGVRASTAQTNKIYVLSPDEHSIAASPFAGFFWHNVAAFHRSIGTPTQEHSTDGTVWTAATLDNRLFAAKQSTTYPIVGPTAPATKGVRWTWASASWSNVRWLIMGFGQSSPASNITVTIESSVDGTVWTQRHTSTNGFSADPAWFYIDSFGGDERLRLTIIHNSGAFAQISEIKLLTARWGQDGGGFELENPLQWDELRNIGIRGAADSTYALTVAGDANADQLVLDTTVPTLATHATRKDYVDTGLAAKADSADLAPVALSGSYSDLTGSPAAHAHDAADLTSGTLAIARIPTGTTSSTVAIGNDARLSVKPYPPVTLTDAATVALNAALGTHFRLSSTANRAIGVPTNPTDGQVIVIEHTATGGSARTLSLTTGTGGFIFGTDITALTATASGLTDYIQAVYRTASSRWHVIAYIKGFA